MKDRPNQRRLLTVEELDEVMASIKNGASVWTLAMRRGMQARVSHDNST